MFNIFITTNSFGYLELLIILIIFLLCFSYFREKNNNKNAENVKVIPGPFCFPIFGYLPFFFKKPPHELLTSLSQKYGDIYQIRLGSKIVVVLNSMPLLKQAMNNRSFMGRPSLPTMKAYTEAENFHRFAMLDSNAEWKLLRSSSIKALKTFLALKDDHFKNLVKKSCNQFHKTIEQHLGEPFNSKPAVFQCTTSISGAINFGSKFDQSPSQLIDLMKMTHTLNVVLRFDTPFDMFTRPLFIRMLIKYFHKFMKPLDILIEENVERHQQHKRDEEDIDLTTILQDIQTGLAKEEFESIHMEPHKLLYASDDVFFAAYFTTTEIFTWALLLLATHANVQNKVAEELKREIGSENFPNVDDRQRTPYTEATILEIFRFSTLNPFLLPHAAVQTDNLDGFSIPKGAVILINKWKINHDPEIYDNPFEFKPERFLNSNGSVDVDFAQNIKPFNVGKRRCIGETLARQEFYLLLASTIAKFSIEPAPAEEVDVHNHVINGIIRSVKPFKLIFRLRQ